MSSTVKYSEIRPNFANSVQNLANSQIDIFWYFQCTVVFFLNGNYQDVHIVYKRKSEKTSSIFFCNNCSRILPHLDALHRWKSIFEYVFNFVEMSTTKQLLMLIPPYHWRCRDKWFSDIFSYFFPSQNRERFMKMVNSFSWLYCNSFVYTHSNSYICTYQASRYSSFYLTWIII